DGGGARGGLVGGDLPHQRRSQGAGGPGHPRDPDREADAMSAPALRFLGPLGSLDLEDRATLFARGSASDPEVRRSVAATIERVRREGDAALRDQMRQFHGVELEALEVPRPRWSAALSALDPPLRAAMDRAAANIEKAHRAALPRVVEVETEPGIVVGRRPDPFARVGIYAP